MQASKIYDEYAPPDDIAESVARPADLTHSELCAWARTALPCGCFLVNNPRAGVELRFCEAHRKVKVARRDPKWPATVAAAVAAVARRKPTFTTDDVWEELGAEATLGGDPRAIGPAMSNAEREGLIDATEEHVKSTRKECHGRPVRVWRSLVLKGKRA